MIILINGSINAGKSTIAKILSGKLGNTAVVEIDALRDFISDVPLTDSIPINLENAVLVIKNFVAHGFNVVVPYPLSRKNYNFLSEGLLDLKSEMHVFTLAPSIEKALRDTEERKLSDWERERITHHYKIGIPNPDFGEVIDTTDQTPEETAGIILSKLGS